MFQLIYVSTAAKPMRKAELLRLFVQRRTRNLENQITGMLLYKGGHFMEVLEGEEENVLKVFHDIERDPQHKSVDTLRAEHTLHRNFPNWTIGFENTESVNLNTTSGFTRFLDADFRPEYFREDVCEAHAMLLAFKQSGRE